MLACHKPGLMWVFKKNPVQAVSPSNFIINKCRKGIILLVPASLLENRIMSILKPSFLLKLMTKAKLTQSTFFPDFLYIKTSFLIMIRSLTPWATKRNYFFRTETQFRLEWLSALFALPLLRSVNGKVRSLICGVIDDRSLSKWWRATNLLWTQWWWIEVCSRYWRTPTSRKVGLQ